MAGLVIEPAAAGKVADFSKAEVEQICPKTHPMVLFSTAENGWECSECKMTFPAGAMLRGCRACDYDICAECVQKVRPAKPFDVSSAFDRPRSLAAELLSKTSRAGEHRAGDSLTSGSTEPDPEPGFKFAVMAPMDSMASVASAAKAKARKKKEVALDLLSVEVPLSDDPTILERGLVYGISLARRADRRDVLAQRCHDADIWLAERLHWVPAVDAQALTWAAVGKSGVLTSEALVEAQGIDWEQDESRKVFTIDSRAYTPKLTRGAVAAALSHRSCWERLREHPEAEWALVLEDDVERFCPSFSSQLAKVLNTAPKGWDLIYLGYHQGRGVATGLRPERKPPLRQARTTVLLQLPPGATEITGIYGYVVSAMGVKRLLGGLFPISEQIDSAMYAYHARNDMLTSYCVDWREMLLYSPPTEKSRDTDIQTFGDFSVAWVGPSSFAPQRGPQDAEGAIPRFFVAGDWTGFKRFEELTPDHRPLRPGFLITLSVPTSLRLRFQVVPYRQWDDRLYPERGDAGSGTKALGPHSHRIAAGRAWLADARSTGAELAEGSEIEVSLVIHKSIGPVVAWRSKRKMRS